MKLFRGSDIRLWKSHRDFWGSLPAGLYVCFAISLCVPFFAVFTPHPVNAFQTIDSIMLAGLVGLMVANSRAAGRAVVTPFNEVEVSDAFLLANFVQLIGLFMIVAALWYWRIEDRPNHLELSFIWFFGRWVYAVGLSGTLAIIWTSHGVVAIEGVKRTAVWTSIAMLLGLLVVWFTSVGVNQ